MRVEVSDGKALARALDKMNVKYSILEEHKADIFAAVNITSLTLALADEGCELLSAAERDESLESYFMNLVGGGSYA